MNVIKIYFNNVVVFIIFVKHTHRRIVYCTRSLANVKVLEVTLIAPKRDNTAEIHIVHVHIYLSHVTHNILTEEVSGRIRLMGYKHIGLFSKVFFISSLFLTRYTIFVVTFNSDIDYFSNSSTNLMFVFYIFSHQLSI